MIPFQLDILICQGNFFLYNLEQGKNARVRPKNSSKEAYETRDSISFGIRNWQTVASDRAKFHNKFVLSMTYYELDYLLPEMLHVLF